MRAGWIALSFCVAPFGLLAITPGSSQPAQRTFDDDVLPVFKAHCLPCHGASKAGGLDLSSYAAFAKGGVNGAVVVPKSPSRSILVQRIKGLGGKPQMPMGFGSIDAKKIKAIEEWILQGAKPGSGKARPHWAYLPVKSSNVPNVVGYSNPIDQFIVARLKQGNLTLSKRADKETLLRRVSLDLTGLPPTLAEQDAFLLDSSQNAYEKVVDRLLQSPHYGERMAMFWLDLARYADTNGYEKDGERSIWPYRDWVIEAFNSNMPYDVFVVKQLAGDLLTNPTQSDLIATGFHRNSMFNQEGGVDPDEGMYEVINDRVATTGTVFLGQSFACARCHDHKYDPTSQRDYFQIYAYFNNNAYEKRGSEIASEMKYWEPEYYVESPEYKQQHTQLDSELQELRSKIKQLEVGARSRFERWIKTINAEPKGQSVALTVTSNARPWRQVEQDWVAPDETPTQEVLTLSWPKGEKEARYAIVLDVDPRSVSSGPGRSSSGNFILSKLELTIGSQSVKPSAITASHVQPGYTLDGLFDDNRESGWAIAPRQGKRHYLNIQVDPQNFAGDTVVAKLSFASNNWPNHVASKVSVRLIEKAYEDVSFLPYDVLESDPKAEASPAWTHFAMQDPEIGPLFSKLKDTEARVRKLEQSRPMTLILRDRTESQQYSAAIRQRGEFLAKGDVVEANTPSFLPRARIAKGQNRLALAKWIVSPNNPLTARVQANRIWEMHFGKGLVETSDNFGLQGSGATHPELLDWLAADLMRNKWNLKRMHRMIVLSETYQQQSFASEALRRRDPTNRLLARGPLVRLEAEAIRDQALVASGMLNKKLGGQSVFPPQPAGAWNSAFDAQAYPESKGPDRYRRGLYTFWKRTSPYPAFMNFDAMSRETCVPRRTQTSTPTQSLTMLNDPALFELANHLGRKMAAVEGSPEDRILYGFRSVLSRHPSKAELLRLSTLVASFGTRYSQRGDIPESLGESPSEAAWTLLASTLLNLSEAQFRN